jgi:flavodoxin
MYKVLILWAPDTAENQAVVGILTRALETENSRAVAKKAAEATIADINCSDLVVFGVGRTGAEDVPADYVEFLRIFKGITLAGRSAGFFSLGSEKATARLRKALKETEIAQAEDDPLFNGQSQDTPAFVAQWARKLLGFHQEVLNARS